MRETQQMGVFQQPVRNGRTLPVLSRSCHTNGFVTLGLEF
jgi:hypothetical protein